jgi:hypothetical protein
MKRERESQECPGCTGTVMCQRWCPVGKHERTVSPASINRGKLPKRYWPATPMRYGPIRAVVSREGRVDTLTCGHSVTVADGGNRKQCFQRRCPQCRDAETKRAA